MAAPDPRVPHSTQRPFGGQDRNIARSGGEAELSRRQLGSDHFEGREKRENQSMAQLQGTQGADCSHRIS